MSTKSKEVQEVSSDTNLVSQLIESAPPKTVEGRRAQIVLIEYVASDPLR